MANIITLRLAMQDFTAQEETSKYLVLLVLTPQGQALLHKVSVLAVPQDLHVKIQATLIQVLNALQAISVLVLQSHPFQLI